MRRWSAACRRVRASAAWWSLRAADSLFVVGPWSRIQQLQSSTHDFIVTELPSEHAEIVPSYRKMPIALTILAAMVLATMFDVLPLVPAVMLASLAAIFTRCLTMQDAYRSIHLSSLVLVAGMLPLADALDAADRGRNAGRCWRRGALHDDDGDLFPDCGARFDTLEHGFRGAGRTHRDLHGGSNRCIAVSVCGRGADRRIGCLLDAGIDTRG